MVWKSFSSIFVCSEVLAHCSTWLICSVCTTCMHNMWRDCLLHKGEECFGAKVVSHVSSLLASMVRVGTVCNNIVCSAEGMFGINGLWIFCLFSLVFLGRPLLCHPWGNSSMPAQCCRSFSEEATQTGWCFRWHLGVFPDPPGTYSPRPSGTPPPAGEQAVCEEMHVLGPILEKGRVRADPKKVRAVEEWERPSDRTQLWRFLGFANFLPPVHPRVQPGRRPALRTNLHPLPLFLVRSGTGRFLHPQDSTTAPVLIFPDPGRQFIVEVDASDVGIGAVLSQHSEEDQQIHPVPQFTSKVWQAFCCGIGATVSLSLGYHPQTNGQAERANQALEATQPCVTTSKPTSWSLHQPRVEYSLNSMVSSATGLSPFQCSLGYQRPLFPSQESEVAVPSVRALLYQWSTTVTGSSASPTDGGYPGQKVWLLAISP